MKKIRQTILAGNWKMHGSRTTVGELLNNLQNSIAVSKQANVIVFPPFVFLEQAERLLSGTAIAWGAQNSANETSGAYTGEVSATMLREFGCQYVLLGHSERRSLYGETDTEIARKFSLALEAGLQPILCVGETLAQRQNGHAQEVVSRQLLTVLEQAGGSAILEKAVLAYEPVWAIGTGLTASPEQAQEIHAFLRQQVAAQDPTIAENLRILYGGSVKSSNANALFAMPDIDGALVGGASLDAQEFIQIYQSLCNN